MFGVELHPRGRPRNRLRGSIREPCTSPRSENRSDSRGRRSLCQVPGPRRHRPNATLRSSYRRRRERRSGQHGQLPATSSAPFSDTNGSPASSPFGQKPCGKLVRRTASVVVAGFYYDPDRLIFLYGITSSNISTNHRLNAKKLQAAITCSTSI